MSNSKFLRALPIVTLLVICIILGTIIVKEKREEGIFIPTIAETEDTGVNVEVTEPPETEIPETEKLREKVMTGFRLCGGVEIEDVLKLTTKEKLKK